MDRKELLKLLFKNEQLQEFLNQIALGHDILAEGLWDCPKAILNVLAQENTKKNILILSGGERESRLYEDVNFFTSHYPLDFPAWETLPSENIPPSPDIVGERYRALHQLTHRKYPSIVICPLQSSLQKLLPVKTFKKYCFDLKKGQKIAFDKLQDTLLTIGYERKPICSDKGEFALRGGILDIFPVGSPDPFRVEFFGDEIESIRMFDPASQKSTQKSDETTLITPAKELELLLKEKTTVSIFEYLGKDTIVFFDDVLALEDRFVNLKNMLTKSSPAFLSFDEFFKIIASFQKIFSSKQRMEELSDTHVVDRIPGNIYSKTSPTVTTSFSLFNETWDAKRWASPFLTLPQLIHPEEITAEDLSGEELLESVSAIKDSDVELIFFASSESEEDHWKQEISKKQIALPKKTTFIRQYLSSGFGLTSPHIALFPFTEVTHRYRLRRQKLRSSYSIPSTELLELERSDLVVHFNHGVGKYLGIEKRPNNLGHDTEFLTLEYAEGSKLFVPMNQSYLITKYVSAQEDIPKLNALGSTRWKKLRSATESAIMGYATSLLELYAKRQFKKRIPYPEDSLDVVKFEAEFPFETTVDQLQAISDIKRDLQSEKVMDRLVCGDVGYGKTEVAMRAAFKVVADGNRQVAVLVPTTVLAMQHYESFCERMANHPLRIACLSRFNTAKDIKKTLEGLAAGSIDIVVGTHRIISKDVVFNNLGLLIIDEEQRFGVKVKEHLKSLKNEVDCLTLSATPIPRTLYMSLVGARDMSVIATPPQDRLPIKTIVADTQNDVMHQALLRELSRDGQAYVIHNRVETIYGLADRIKKLLPGARVLVAHGQMSAEELDATFHAFKTGRADILVATTIVENGIDIPNANTILIDRADQYGLADLYQLRGRVGRWNRRAYAYFLIPFRKALSETAKKRIDALAGTSGFGGGMRIAMRDLEIRGGGDILGFEQSGHIGGIGFHLYCKLLRRTVDALQGKGSLILLETRVDFPQDARLPEDYIDASGLRMEFYQRLGDAQSLQEVDKIYEELQDRFGKPPLPVIWLYHLTRLKVFAASNDIVLLKFVRLTLSVERKVKGKSIHNAFTLNLPTDPKLCEEKIVALLKRELKAT